jgi:hypothetical protein
MNKPAHPLLKAIAASPEWQAIIDAIVAGDPLPKWLAKRQDDARYPEEDEHGR